MRQDDLHDLQDLLRDAARTYNRAPEPPLDAMWRAIEPSLGQRRWTRQWSVWGAIAAALLVGVGLGRLTASRAVTTGQAPAHVLAAAAAPDSTAVSQSATAPVTDRYLSQTAALLIALPAASADSASRGRLSARAAELLVTTRLLLDSRDAEDPQLRGLLEDLELVLAQVARLPEARGRGRQDLELIHQALDQRDVIPRLRDVVSTVSGSDD